MKVKIERNNIMKSLQFNGTVIDLLIKLKINPEDVLVVKNNTLLTKKEKLSNKDSIEIFSVFSGG